MEHKTFKTGAVAHQFARVLYWCSILLLLAGMWIMIDPYHRKIGETFHVYITLIAFELYMWLLLLLARWQVNKGLTVDTARSGIFLVALTGVVFIALNELYMASVSEARFISALAFITAAAKLILARRWLGLQLPTPLLASCCLWMLVLLLPAPIIHSLLDSKSNQHLAAYLMCWVVALLVGGHLALVAWQMRRGFNGANKPLQQWWVGWFLPALLAALTIGQLYATMWGLFVEWSHWYFSPILLAGGVVCVCLSHACQRRRLEAWALMIMLICFVIAVSADPIPSQFPSQWQQGVGAYAVHPIYPAGVFLSVLLAAAGLLIQNWWLFGTAWVAPVSTVAFKATQAVWEWPHGKGVALLIGAFVLLAAGALLQWWKVNYSFTSTNTLENTPNTLHYKEI